MSRLSNALIAHWKMNDNADSNAVVDATGNHNGTYHGTGGPDDYTSSHDVTGKINTALEFDGTQDYIEVADHNDFSFGDGTDDSPFSISAWIYMDDSDGFIIASKYDTNKAEWQLEVGGDNFQIFLFSENDGGKIRGRICSSEMSTGQWYHTAMTYDGRGGTLAYDGIKLYVDGVREDDIDLSISTYVAMKNETASPHIGRYGTYYADGKIDNVMIFNVELTAGEVDRLYNNGRGTETLTGVEIRTTLPRRIGKSSLPLRVRYEK